MKAIIAGGGVAGLSAAICLANEGWSVEVFERSVTTGESGAGLQISPNGAKLLDAMGVTPFIEDALFEPEALELRMGTSGRRIFRIPLRDFAKQRWGARYFQIHRADLIEALRTCVANHANITLTEGTSVTGYANDGVITQVLMQELEPVDCDLLVAADGIRSVLREQMHKPQPARFTGNVAWRAVVPAKALGGDLPPPTGCVWAGEGKHAVTTRLRGGDAVNFVGVVEHNDWREEGWRIEGKKEDALADFSGWHTHIRRVIEEAGTMYRWALFDRTPLPFWNDGSVVLIGDAAHAMLPSMAQGAVQSIEDAWVLSQELKASSTVEEACKAFFAKRIERTARVQRGSAANMRLFHKAGGLRGLAIYGPLWIAGHVFPQVLNRTNDWLYGAEFGTSTSNTSSQ